ncbi:MAG: hypothetical protein Q7S27_01205 [Nanoarchaeota archaeon]|nr:hypothetical protein [Nanoarchaeota archaeon]
MEGKEIYDNLSRLNDLDEKEKLTREEEIEYRNLSRKRLYTLDELRDYSNVVKDISPKKIASYLNKFRDSLESNNEVEIPEDLPDDIQKALYSLEDRINEIIDNISLEDVLDNETILEINVNLRERILSGIRHRHGNSIEEELYSIIYDELKSGIEKYKK